MFEPPFARTFTDTLDRPVRLRGCDHPGCGQAGDFRAPKGRDRLTDYYWFCLAHVRDYNARWDYCAGLSSADIERAVREAMVGERPTWPLGSSPAHEQAVRDTVREAFFGETSGFQAAPPMPSHEREALAMLELTPPVDLAAIKAQYRRLVKRHHPDAHQGNPATEERFKAICAAYGVLRGIYRETGV